MLISHVYQYKKKVIQVLCMAIIFLLVIGQSSLIFASSNSGQSESVISSGFYLNDENVNQILNAPDDAPGLVKRYRDGLKPLGASKDGITNVTGTLLGKIDGAIINATSVTNFTEFKSQSEIMVDQIAVGIQEHVNELNNISKEELAAYPGIVGIVPVRIPLTNSTVYLSVAGVFDWSEQAISMTEENIQKIEAKVFGIVDISEKLKSSLRNTNKRLESIRSTIELLKDNPFFNVHDVNISDLVEGDPIGEEVVQRSGEVRAQETQGIFNKLIRGFFQWLINLLVDGLRPVFKDLDTIIVFDPNNEFLATGILSQNGGFLSLIGIVSRAIAGTLLAVFFASRLLSMIYQVGTEGKTDDTIGGLVGRTVFAGLLLLFAQPVLEWFMSMLGSFATGLADLITTTTGVDSAFDAVGDSLKDAFAPGGLALVRLIFCFYVLYQIIALYFESVKRTVLIIISFMFAPFTFCLIPISTESSKKWVSFVSSNALLQVLYVFGLGLMGNAMTHYFHNTANGSEWVGFLFCAALPKMIRTLDDYMIQLGFNSGRIGSFVGDMMMGTAVRNAVGNIGSVFSKGVGSAAGGVVKGATATGAAIGSGTDGKGIASAGVAGFAGGVLAGATGRQKGVLGSFANSSKGTAATIKSMGKSDPSTKTASSGTGSGGAVGAVDAGTTGSASASSSAGTSFDSGNVTSYGLNDSGAFEMSSGTGASALESQYQGGSAGMGSGAGDSVSGAFTSGGDAGLGAATGQQFAGDSGAMSQADIKSAMDHGHFTARDLGAGGNAKAITMPNGNRMSFNGDPLNNGHMQRMSNAFAYASKTGINLDHMNGKQFDGFAQFSGHVLNNLSGTQRAQMSHILRPSSASKAQSEKNKNK
ncbi:MAG: hypothetical protein ACOX2M_03680 [Fastidiosipilaceae bacterium]